MTRTFLNAKIHKATVTDSKIEYVGSCQIDIELLNAVNKWDVEKNKQEKLRNMRDGRNSK